MGRDRVVILYALHGDPRQHRLIELSGYAAGVHCLRRTYGARLHWYGRIREDSHGC